MDPVALLITVLVIVLVAWACFWVIDRAIPGRTPSLIAKAIVGILALVALLTQSGLM